MKLSKAQRGVVNEVRETYSRGLRKRIDAGELPEPTPALEALEHAVIAATDVERERMAAISIESITSNCLKPPGSVTIA